MAAASAYGATEGDRDKASVLVERGLNRARAGRFAEAAELFQNALRLYPDPAILHSLARAHEELGHLGEAYDAFHKALAMDPAYLYAEDARKRIQDLVKTLRATHAFLRIRSTPSKVHVFVRRGEDILAGHLITPFERWVPAGVLEVSGERPGFESVRSTVTVAAGDDASLELVLRPVQRKGFLMVNASVAGARVLVDGNEVGRTPYGPTAYGAGAHTVRVEADGHEPQQVSIVVVPDEEARVSLTLVSLTEAPGRGSGASGGDMMGGVLLGASAATLVGSVLIHTAGFTMADNARAKFEEVAQYNSNQEHDAAVAAHERGMELVDKAMAQQLIAVVGYGISAILAGVGTVMLLDDGEPPGSDEPGFVTSAVTPTFVVSPDGLFVGATWRF